MAGLAVRKVADKSGGDRVVRYDPATGERKLVNPATPGDDHEPWPLLGVVVEGETPQTCRVPTSFVQLGVAEGWIEREGEGVVHRAGGPPSDPWRSTHTFVQADTIVLHLADGDLSYRVVHQPDKYADASRQRPYDPATDDNATTVVDWFYDLELEA